jgi:hypothetical protein
MKVWIFLALILGVPTNGTAPMWIKKTTHQPIYPHHKEHKRRRRNEQRKQSTHPWRRPPPKKIRGEQVTLDLPISNIHHPLFPPSPSSPLS